MKKSIYFHIDEYNRDTIVAAGLFKKLRKEFNFFFGNRLDEFRLKNYDVFDIYIFPSLDKLENAFKEPKNCKGKIFILPHESISGSTKVKKRLELHLTGVISNKVLKKKWLSKINGFFLWGKSHYKVLKNYSKEISNKCIIVGHPRHDKTFYKKNSKKNKKFSVGLVSRFDRINIFDDRINFENIYNGWLDKFSFNYAFDNKRNLEHQFFNLVLDFRFFLDIILLLNKKKIIPEIRPHPRENRNNWFKFRNKANLDFEIGKFDETFVDWINRQDLIICSASTSLYDCVLLNKNTIVIDNLSNERAKHGNLYLDDFDPIIKYLNRPKSIETIEKILFKKSKVKFTKSLKKLLNNEVNYPDHNNSLEKIKNVLTTNLSAETDFNYFKLIKQKIFVISQNYIALKFLIKRAMGFKEVSSVFSLGFLRYRRIKNYFND